MDKRLFLPCSLQWLARWLPAKTRPTVTVVEMTPDAIRTYQTIAGFGRFGGLDVYWSIGPYTSQRFVDDIVTYLDCTIIRDELPTSFEIDNADPA